MTNEETIKIIRKYECNKEHYEACEMAIKALEQEPKIGRWISHREHCEMNNLRPSGLGSYFWCSECDCGIDVIEWHRNHYNYCPNCGAKMERPCSRKSGW